jgi:multicomponent Na+:H+ antiporter subunit E
MRAEREWRWIRFMITALTLFGLWLLFATSLSGFALAAGAVGSIIIAGLTYDVFIAKHQANIRFILPNPIWVLLYLPLLVFKLYGSSILMLIAVFTGNINPRIVHFKTRLRSDFARMLLANSITLTPGTITLDLNDDHLTVHWMFSTTSHAKAAGNAVKGAFERVIGRIWL